MDLAIFLKKDREEKCLTQKEYSKQIGLTRATLAHLEVGRPPSADTAKKLVNYFQRPLSELIGTNKFNKISHLETTNMLIDSLINRGQIINLDFSKEVKDLIWKSLVLEINLKLEVLNKTSENSI